MFISLLVNTKGISFGCKWPENVKYNLLKVHCKVILEEITLNEKMESSEECKTRHYGTQITLYVHVHLK